MLIEQTRRRLADVADVVMGQSPPGNTYNENGVGLPFLQGAAEFGRRYPTPQKHCSIPRKIAEPGELLLSVRAPVGRMNFAPERLAVGRGLAVLRAHRETSVDYLAVALEAELPQLLARSGAGMFQSITGSALKDVVLDMPPFEVQQAIASVVGRAESAVTAASTYTVAAARLRTALRAETLGGLRATATESVVASLGSFARGGSFPRCEQGRTSGDHPVFKVNDMNREGNERELRMPENWVTAAQLAKLKMKLWPPGTVVFARVGAALGGDRRRMLVRPSVLDDNMFGLVPDSKQVLPYYLMLALEGAPLSTMAQQGAVPSINARMVGAVTVPVPSLPEQTKIEEVFRALDSAEELGRTRLRQAERLRKSLVSRYFPRTTVPTEVHVSPTRREMAAQA